MNGELRIQVTEEDADAERLDVLAGYLRRDLVQLDLGDVAALRAGPPPPGARSADIAAIGALIVAVGGTADGLRLAVGAVRDWLRRGDEVGRSVRLELDGDALELSAVSAEDQDRLIELFLSRHAAATPPAATPPAAKPSAALGES
jgi:hypothetical protein